MIDIWEQNIIAFKINKHYRKRLSLIKIGTRLKLTGLKGLMKLKFWPWKEFFVWRELQSTLSISFLDF